MRQRSKPGTVAEKAAAPRLTPDEVRARTFQRAAKLLAAKPRSIAELRERLAERCSSKAVIETVIARLREYGYLDDERFALSYASSKVRQQPIGRRRLEQSLTRKKVERSVANEALDQVFAETSEEELLDRAIEKRVRLRGRPKTRAEAKSLFDHLLRQGFPFELVSDKVRAATQTNLDEGDGV
jgi:regulatory protein